VLARGCAAGEESTQASTCVMCSGTGGCRWMPSHGATGGVMTSEEGARHKLGRPAKRARTCPQHHAFLWLAPKDMPPRAFPCPQLNPTPTRLTRSALLKNTLLRVLYFNSLGTPNEHLNPTLGIGCEPHLQAQTQPPHVLPVQARPPISASPVDCQSAPQRWPGLDLRSASDTPSKSVNDVVDVHRGRTIAFSFD